MGDLMRDTTEFGKKINELRLKNDMSLRDLGEKAGVSYSFINSIEKGRYSPSRETVIALANVLKGANKNELLLLAGFSPEEEIKTPKKMTLKEFLEQPGVPYDENTYIPEEKLKALRELLESVAEKLPDSEEREKNE